MTAPLAHESGADYGGRWAVVCYDAESVALNAAAARRGNCWSAFRQKINAAGIAPAAQSAEPPLAEFSPSLARYYEVFFGARVAIQPQTTSAIIAARKIPSSAMLFLRRPAWGGIKSCAVTLTA
jgi:hypothetical protein